MINITQILAESRISEDFARYESNKDRNIVYLRGAKASQVTKYVKALLILDKKIKDAAEEKKSLNDRMNSMGKLKDALDERIRGRVFDLFDQHEQAMTLCVSCTGSGLTLAKETAVNKDKVIKGEQITNVDYEKAFNMLAELYIDLADTFNTIKESCTTIIQEEDTIKKGSKRALRPTVTESLADDIKGLYDKITGYFKTIKDKLFSAYKRYKEVDILIKTL